MGKGTVTIALTALLAASLGNVTYCMTVTVDGKRLDTFPRPVIRSGRAFIPVDAVRRIGLWVGWRRGERRAEVAWPETDVFIYFEAGRGAYPGGQSLEQEEISRKERRIPPSSFMYRGFLMIPLRSLVELSGKDMLTLQWDGRARSVNVQRRAYWTKWRREIDEQLRKHRPDRYGPVL
ncbi:MAG TPA: hypothetical protein VMX94_02220 [Armatimonadota bacterium]|nr:hypothetical protein [Armatimonadota bacterium]